MLDPSQVVDRVIGEGVDPLEASVFHKRWNGEPVSAIELIGDDLLGRIRTFGRGELDILVTRKTTNDVLIMRAVQLTDLGETEAALRDVLQEILRL
jgi:hypothetical protein